MLNVTYVNLNLTKYLTQFFEIFLKVFPQELPIYYREHENAMYRSITYYLSKIFIDVIKTIKCYIKFIFFQLIYFYNQAAQLSHYANNILIDFILDGKFKSKF